MTTSWPALPLAEWQATYDTLHLYTQVIGKLRLALSPPENEWWHVPLYVTARGLGTPPLPYGDRSFQIDFDFLDHQLVVRACDGALARLPLVPRTVADFYATTMRLLDELGFAVRIWPVPVELPDPIRFCDDATHRAYDAAAVRRFFEVLRRVDVAFKRFRGRFVGKSSPVHFFWGAFDLAVSRFSGRPAPPRPGANRMVRLAYDQEVLSVGWWPGGSGVDEAAFYAYAWPEPRGFRTRAIAPTGAYYHEALEEWILPYERVRRDAAPAERILEFAESSYRAGAELAGWDRALEAAAWSDAQPDRR